MANRVISMRTRAFRAVAAAVLLLAACPVLPDTSSGVSGTFGLKSGCLSSDRPVVVLVRGLKAVPNLMVPQQLDNAIYWTDLEPQLWDDFEIWRCDTINSLGSQMDNANALSSFIQQKVAERGSTPAEIDIIAHSMGGLMTRQYMALPGNQPYRDRVKKVITLSTPHCGSHIADLVDKAVSYACNRADAPWAQVVIDCLWPAPHELTENYVINNFDKRVTNTNGAAFYFLGGNGGVAGGNYVYSLTDVLLRTWPPGRYYNLSDGMVTLRSAHGQYQSLTLHGYKENKLVRASRSPRGQEYLYQFVVDHTQIKQGAGGVIDTIKAILWNRPPEPGSPVYSGFSMADSGSGAAWQPVGGASGFLQNTNLYTHTFPVETAAHAAFSCRIPNGDARFSLIAPGGGRIESTVVNPNVTFSEQWDETGRVKTYSLTDPAPGQWTLEVYGNSVSPSGEDYAVDARVESPLGLLAETPYVQSIASPVVVLARLDSGGAGVPGQTLTGMVVDKFGTIATDLTLYDDGAHSDGPAGDGVYGNSASISAPGFYTVSFAASGTTGGNAFARVTGTDVQVSNPTASLGAVVSDQAVNTGGGQGKDTLRVAVPLNVTSGTGFTISAALYAGDQEVARTSATRSDCVTGANTFNLDFKGADIRASGTAGPYKLGDITVFDNIGEPPYIVQQSAGGYTTHSYLPGQFNDGTPPSGVVDLSVTGTGATSANLAWSAPVDDSGAAAYDLRWAPEPVTLVNWDSATPLTGLPAPKGANQPETFIATGLPPGSTCYFGLRSTDAAGNVSSLSNSPKAVLQVSFDPGSTAPGASVAFEGVVTDIRGTYADRVCVQSPDAPWGIWCDFVPPAGLARGDRVQVSGTYSVSSGERRLNGSTATKLSSGTVEPAVVASRSIGGSAMGAYMPGVRNGVGVNTSGALVTTCGRVTYTDPASPAQYFTVWDGSTWQGATNPADQDGHAGVRVWAPGMAPAGLAAGKYISVTGISGCQKSGDDLYPLIRVRDSRDITVVAP